MTRIKAFFTLFLLPLFVVGWLLNLISNLVKVIAFLFLLRFDKAFLELKNAHKIFT